MSDQRQPKARRTGWQIYRPALAFGGLSLVGLCLALLGDGPLDLASWLSLGAIPATMLYFWNRAAL